MRVIRHGLQIQHGSRRENLPGKGIYSIYLGADNRENTLRKINRDFTLVVDKDQPAAQFMYEVGKKQAPVVIRNIDYETFEGAHPHKIYFIAHYQEGTFNKSMTGMSGQTQVTIDVPKDVYIFKISEIPLSTGFYNDLGYIYPLLHEEVNLIRGYTPEKIKELIFKKNTYVDNVITPACLLHILDHEVNCTRASSLAWETQIRLSEFKNRVLAVNYYIMMNGYAHLIIYLNYGLNCYPMVAKFADWKDNLNLVDIRIDDYQFLESFLYSVLNKQNLDKILEAIAVKNTPRQNDGLRNILNNRFKIIQRFKFDPDQI